MLTKDEIRELLPHGDQWMADVIDQPEFSGAGRVHDWRNYIPSTLRALWNRLSTEARVVAVIMADCQASQEEWD